MAEIAGTKRQLDPTFSSQSPKTETSKTGQTSREQFGQTPMSARKQRPDPEEIRGRIERRAYELYEQRGRSDGRELDDWLRAEQEVTSETIEAAD